MDRRAAGLKEWTGKLPAWLLILILSTSWSCGKISGVRMLYLAHANTTTHPIHKGLLYLKQVLEEKSGGKMTVKVFADGQLGSEREVLELLQIGSVAMTKVSAAVMANFAPEYEILSVPYLYRDADHAWRVRDSEIGQDILASSSKYLLKGLCYYDAGFRSFYTKDKPIRTPDDLKGLKIRVMNHKMSIDMVAALGGAATPMAYGELYTALQQGVVDAEGPHRPRGRLAGLEAHRHHAPARAPDPPGAELVVDDVHARGPGAVPGSGRQVGGRLLVVVLGLQVAEQVLLHPVGQPGHPDPEQPDATGGVEVVEQPARQPGDGGRRVGG